MFSNILILITLIISLGLILIVIYPYLKTKYLHIKYRNNSRHIFYPLAGYHATLQGGKPLNTTLDKLITTKGQNQKFIITNFFTKPCVVITDWKMAKQFLVHFQKYVINDIDFLFQQVFSQKELVTHQNWKKHKKILSNTMNFEFFQFIMHDVRTIAQNTIGQIQYNKPYKIYDETFKITQQVISYAFFSKSVNSVKLNGIGLMDKLREISNCVFGTLFDPVFILRYYILRKPSDQWGIFLSKKQKAVLHEFRTVIAMFKELIQQRIKEHNENTSQKSKYSDFLQAYIKVYVSKQNQNKKYLILEQIIDQFTTILGAGSHSTSLVTGNCLYYLAKYPEWYRKLEIIANELPKQYTLKQLNKYNEISFFIKEVARLNPPSYTIFPRRCKQDMKILDFQFKKDTYVELGIYDIMNNPQYFDSPNEFRPERWNDEITKVANYPFYIFGGGPRNCLGEQIAMIQMKTILIEYIRHTRISLNEKSEFKIKIEVFYSAHNQDLIILNKK